MTSFELSFTSVESYARLYVKTSTSIFSNYTETTRTTYDTRYRYHVPRIYSKQQFAAGTPIVLLYEKGDAVRIEPRSSFPNTCRLCAPSSGTLFRSQAGGDAPGCRAYSASPEHRVGSLLIVGHDETLWLTAAAARGARRQLLTMAHTSTASSVPMPCRTEKSWLRAGRVWACTRPLQSVHAAPELVCRGRVVVLVSYVVSTDSLGRVILDYCSCTILLHVCPNPSRYHVIT